MAERLEVRESKREFEWLEEFEELVRRIYEEEDTEEFGKDDEALTEFLEIRLEMQRAFVHYKKEKEKKNEFI